MLLSKPAIVATVLQLTQVVVAHDEVDDGVNMNSTEMRQLTGNGTMVDIESSAMFSYGSHRMQTNLILAHILVMVLA